MSVAVILPAHEEMDWIGPCLDAVLDSTGTLPAAREIIVVANACTDGAASAAILKTIFALETKAEDDQQRAIVADALREKKPKGPNLQWLQRCFIGLEECVSPL
jgi:hypothetical protein